MVTTERRVRGARWTCALIILFTAALAAFLAPTGSAASTAGNAAAPTFSTPCFTPAAIHNGLPPQQTGSYTVPATGVSTVRAVLRGQNGGRGGYDYNFGGISTASTAGGLGATLVVEVAVTPGQVLHVGRLTGAPGGAGSNRTEYSGGKGGDAQYLSTAGSDGCQHALAVAGGGGGGSGSRADGGNADAGAGATGGQNGGANDQVDGAGGGGAQATIGGTPGKRGTSNRIFSECNDGNNGRWGEFLTGGDGGHAPARKDFSTGCSWTLYPGGGGGGAGYRYGGGGGSPFGHESNYATHDAGAGGGGSSYIDPSATKISLSAAANTGGDPVVAPVYSTTTTLSGPPGYAYPRAGESMTMTAHVTSASPTQSVAGGTVEFFDRIPIPGGGGALIRTFIGTAQVGSTGDATLATASLSAGLHYPQACFLGTANTTAAHSSSCGSYQQLVDAAQQCFAAAPSFTGQPTDATVAYGEYVFFTATMSSPPDFVNWQFSSDGGTTWTNDPGSNNYVQNNTPAPGSYYTYDRFLPSVSQSGMKVRVVASTCGGTTASNTATLTVRGIAFDLTSLPAKTYGNAPFDISSYAAQSSVAVSFSSATPAVCTVSGYTVTILAAGTCTIDADDAGTTYYPTAPQVRQSFTVNKKVLSVVAGSPPSQPQGTASAPTVTCTAGFLGSDGFVEPPTGAVYAIVSYDSVGDPIYRRVTDFAAMPQRTYFTRCTGGNPGSSYTIGGYTNGTFTIGPLAPPTLTITANNKSYTYGTTPPALDVTYSSSSIARTGTLSCGVYAKSDTGYANPLALSSTTPVVTGGYAIRCSGITSSSNPVAWANGTLTVNPASVAVTAGSPATQTHGTTAAPSVTCAATGFVGADSFVTNPTGAVYDASGTDQVSIGSTASAGEYVTKCAGGDPGSNYTISEYTPGTFTVRDTTAPAISGTPGDQTAEATGPDGAVVTYTTPTANDLVDGSRTVTCAPVAGGTFAIGATTVTCSASDTSGNNASTSFTVSVRDTTPPAISGTPANITVETAGPGGAAVTYTAPTATDLVDGARPVTCTLSSGSTFAIGTATVGCSATDTRSNSASATFTVTVRDTTPPVITVGNVAVNATSPAGATLPFTTTATDVNPASPVVTCTPASGSTFGIGSTTVNCSATDAAGNTGTASFTVTVKSAGTQLADLQAKVQSLPLDPTARKNLRSILQNAQASAGKGDLRGACDKLSSFVSQVQALSGKKIATPAADGLLIDARRIMAVLGCS